MRWGLVTTVKAPAADILRFAAYHLDAGAHRLFLYLDARSEAFATLKAHPKIRVTDCNADWWSKKKQGRPDKHQVRQVMNATHAYRRGNDIDWLGHIDVDEFLVSPRPVADLLADLPPYTQTVRTRPMEALHGDGTTFKGHIAPGPNRAPLVAQIYPTYGQYVKGGFLSHVAGKVFIRKGLDNVRLKIHNAFQDQDMNPNEVELKDLKLAHLHAASWQDWIAAYRYRVEKGSYRAELAPNVNGGLTMHDLLTTIEAEEGEAGLRAFYEELCVDSPALRARLEAHGLLERADLDLDTKLQRHFPDFPVV